MIDFEIRLNKANGFMLKFKVDTATIAKVAEVCLLAGFCTTTTLTIVASVQMTV
ncbi:MAG: hypothetical protein AAF639_11765 [Chloroflexota bacterium]